MGLTMIDLGLIVKVTELIFCHGLLSSIHLVYWCIVTYYELYECQCVYFGGATSVTVAISSASQRTHVKMQW